MSMANGSWLPNLVDAAGGFKLFQVPSGYD